MENKNILLLRRHPMNVYFTNSFYTNQTVNDLSEYEIFDVTSRIMRNKEFMKKHPTFAKDLSPFFVGPVKTSDGTMANLFEVYWQYAKVYPCHDDNGKPNSKYFEWRNEYYAKTACSKDEMRHSGKTIGCEDKEALYSAYFDKEKGEYIPLGYVEARKKMYFPEYAKLVYNTESYKWLKSLVDSGKKIALVDFDAYNYYEDQAKLKKYESYVTKCKKEKVMPKMTENQLLQINSMKDLINSPYLSGGHACVLKAMLQGDIEIVNGEVVDKAGILI